MTSRGEHECIGVYLNGDSVATRVSDDDLAPHVAYDAAFRPGRLLFVDGEYVGGGLLRRPRLDETVARLRAVARRDGENRERTNDVNTIIKYFPANQPAYGPKTTFTVGGLMSPDQLVRIVESLHDDDQFEPRDVGIPDAPDGGPCRLIPGFADFTSARPTADVSIEQLTAAFEDAARRDWPSRRRDDANEKGRTT